MLQSLAHFCERVGGSLAQGFRRLGTTRTVVLSVFLLLVGLAISLVVTNWPEEIVYGNPLPTNTPTDVAAFVKSQEATPSIGYRVFLNDVELRSGPAADVYFVGESGKTQAVLLWTDDNKPELPEPTIADISGVIQPIPSSTVLRREWKLKKKQERKEVGDSPVYIMATKVTFRSKPKSK